MTDQSPFFTRTMARVHADQGNLDQAAEIYRYLIKKEPGRTDLVRDLADIEKRIIEEASDRLVTLFGEWFDLVLTYNRIKKLKKLRQVKP